MIYIAINETKQPSFVAFGDAARQHADNWGTFSKAVQDNVVAIEQLAKRTYPSSRVFINARQSFIAVKVDHPKHSIIDAAASNELQLLVDALNAIDVRTTTARIFRIPK